MNYPVIVTEQGHTGTDLPIADGDANWTTRHSIKKSWLLLVLILCMQGALSERLLSSNTAFTDEGLYLWAGRLEWLGILHGASVPPMASYFSGSPVFYPPLAELANAIDGLAGARLLSLVFMLGATVLLWKTASLLFGSLAAFFSSLVWVILGPTSLVGSLATFDSMSIFLVAVAAWCLVKARSHINFVRWILGGAAALAAANAACYSSAIFDPIIVVFALLIGVPRSSDKRSLMRSSSFVFYVVFFLVLLIIGGGAIYWTGISRTVLERAPGTASRLLLLRDFWDWTGPVTGAAIVGLVVATFSGLPRQTKALIALLLFAGLIVPLEQIRIQTLTSFNKHADAGAWFSALPAGYCLSRLARFKTISVSLVICVVMAGATLLFVRTSVDQANGFEDWANVRQFVSVLRPLAERKPGPLLVETPSPARYYLEDSVKWQRWSSTTSVNFPDGKSEGAEFNVAGSGNKHLYVRLVTNGYFSVIALNYFATPKLDADIRKTIMKSGHYRFLRSVPYGPGRYMIWARL